MSGPLADRIGARIVAAIGCVVLAGGLVIMSRAGDEPVFDIAYLFGVGVGVGLCFVPTVGAVQVLCRDNPAVAGAIAASGIGLGTFVLPSLAQLLIDHIGWRQTLLLLGVLAPCGGLAALPLAESGTVNDRDRVPHSSPSPPRLAELMRSRRFLLLYVAQLLISLVAFVPFAHLALFAKTKGWPIATGGYLIGVIGIGSLCARLLVGIVAQSHGSCRAQNFGDDRTGEANDATIPQSIERRGGAELPTIYRQKQESESDCHKHCAKACGADGPASGGFRDR
jgi:MFS transporter, OFA family, oxalate/formate antiporter